MSLKPWREIAVPHPDVLEGTFQQSEFAADITAVHTGKATRIIPGVPAASLMLHFAQRWLSQNPELPLAEFLTLIRSRLGAPAEEHLRQIQCGG